jgi:hypothetical protein
VVSCAAYLLLLLLLLLLLFRSVRVSNVQQMMIAIMILIRTKDYCNSIGRAHTPGLLNGEFYALPWSDLRAQCHHHNGHSTGHIDLAWRQRSERTIQRLSIIAVDEW